jgi:hypothetical protein
LYQIKRGKLKMPAEQICLDIIRGDSWSRKLYFSDLSGNIIDITGWKIYFMAKFKIDDLDSAAVITKTITSFDNPTSGEATLSLSSVDTDIEGSFLYSIKVITNNMVGVAKEAITVLTGVLNISSRVIQTTS